MPTSVVDSATFFPSSWQHLLLSSWQEPLHSLFSEQQAVLADTSEVLLEQHSAFAATSEVLLEQQALLLAQHDDSVASVETKADFSLQQPAQQPSAATLVTGVSALSGEVV